jgi:dynactin 6
VCTLYLSISSPLLQHLCTGVECPAVGNFNTIGPHAQVHHTVRMSSYCVIGAACLVVPTEDRVLDDYSVIYGAIPEQDIWSGRGKVREVDLRQVMKLL